MIDIKELEYAFSLCKEGKIKKAEEAYLQLLKRYPEDSVLLSAFGLFYASTKQYDKASKILEKAYNIKKTAGTISAFGISEYERKNYTKAAELLTEALNYTQNPDIYDKLISCLFEIKHYKEAINYTNKMYELYPEEDRAAAHKIKALTQTGKLIDAERICVEFLKKNPNSPIMWFHLGYLKELIYCNDSQAKECYKNAERLGSKEAFFNIAVSCMKLGEKDDAEKYYKKMLEFFPDSTDTKNALGMLYLSEKKFNEGYSLFCKRPLEKVGHFSNNVWQPGDKIDDDVVIICEQGFGDHIQFIRYLPFVPSKNIKIAAMKQLKNLFQTNYPDFEFIDYKEINPNTQSIRITDLTYALNINFENIPFSEGYLKAATKNISSDKPKIGLCWEAGAAGHRTLINRTIHVKCFEPFFELNNIQIYSFQYDDTFKGNEKYPQMINLTKDFNDFTDTAEALNAMDLLITVDTAVAHLAGALGIKTFLLLPYTSDWRWFEDTKTTPWYDSIEIFKQTDSISWKEPLNEILDRLKKLN